MSIVRPLAWAVLLQALTWPAAAAPYDRLPVTVPNPPPHAELTDALKRLGAAALAHDGEAVAALYGPGFFYERDLGGSFDPAKSARENADYALSIGHEFNAEGRTLGFRTLVRLAAARSFEPVRGALCGPASPSYDARKAERLAEKASPLGWPFGFGYVTGTEVAIHAEARKDAVAIGHLTREAVAVEDWEPQGRGAGFVPVVAPSGRKGFIAFEEVFDIGGAKLCWQKVGTAWRIAGFVGGGD